MTVMHRKGDHLSIRRSENGLARADGKRMPSSCLPGYNDLEPDQYTPTLRRWLNDSEFFRVDVLDWVRPNR